MVHVTLYSCNSAPNTINKTIVGYETVNAELYENDDILNPSLKLAWKDTYASNFNYCYIQEFKRYYFINKITAETGGAARFDCHVDVLYTYAAALNACDLYITRAGKEGKPTLINDTQFPLKAKKKIMPYRIASTFFNLNSADTTSRNYVVNLIGDRNGGGD